MSGSLIAAFGWLALANLLAMIPSKDNHWTRAYVLIALGLPLLAWVFWQNGVWVGLLVLAAGASVLRWPLRYLWAWLRRVTGRAA
ncbi:DUF2484 family protein [Litorisediminicola beolgyonensis]|uniref:DUF2484 family protein n=1 Tax=Litorisediminicola beolgyonensis TaxID=1173614 RepID=A0ABW3ZNM4_9RHOB